MKLRVTVVAILLVCLSSSLVGQGTTSRLLGTVVDPSGAPVTGARVVLKSEATGAAFTVATSESGTYGFEAVQAGVYTVTAEATGFKTFTSKGNVVNIGQPTTVNIRLDLGSVTETVEVAATAEAVQTSTSGNFGNLFSDRTIRDLPIVGTRGRNPLELVLRQPGVVSGSNTGGGIHVHGARDRAWNYTLDGIDSNETSAGGSNTSPLRSNPDSLGEFRVITGNATAEMGRSSGGQVAMITRSGANELHGSGFWFYRTPRFNANEWENNINNLGKRQFVQHIWGGSVGGPIVRNKLFYFGNLQMLRARESAQVDRTVYTSSARQGLLRYNRNGRNLPAGVAGASVDAQGNVMPGISVGTYNTVTSDPARLGFDPTLKGLVDQTPLPNNFNGGDGLNTALFSFAALQSEKQYDATVKVDYVINDRNLIFGRFSQGSQDTLCDRVNGGQPLFPGLPCPVDTYRDPRNWVVNWRSTLSPKMTNEFAFGRNNFGFVFDNPYASLDKPNYTTVVQLPIANYYNNYRILNTYQIIENLSYQAGSHSLRFGANIRLQRHNDTRGSIAGYNATQDINFSRTINLVDPTAFGLPSDLNQAFDRPNFESHINLLLGRVGSTNRGFVAKNDQFTPGLFEYVSQYNEYDFFAQDTWKVLRNLTVDLGLRWELRPAPTTPDAGRMLAPNQAMVAGGTPSSTVKWVEGAIYPDRNMNIGPSVGVAWDPLGTGKTSIRGNYRLAYDRVPTFLFSSFLWNNLPGLTIGQVNQTYGQNGGRLRSMPALTPPAQKPSQLTQPVPFSVAGQTVVDPNFEMPATHQWSFSFQRELWGRTVAEVSYFGRRAHNLQGAYNVNQVEFKNNGFLDSFNVVKAGGQSPLMNQLLDKHPSRRATETGSDMVRRLFLPTLQNNAVGALASNFSTVIVGNGSLSESGGFGPYYFIPYPQYAGGLTTLDTNDFSTYHGLEFQVTKRFSKGLEVQGSYAFSKSLDTRSFDPTFTAAATGNSQSASSTPFDIYNRRGNYGLSDFDRTHVLQSYWIYELPFGRGKAYGNNSSGFVERLIGGWQVSGQLTVSAGRPFTVYSGFLTYANVVQSTANCTGCTRADGDVFDDPRQGLKFYFDGEQRAKFSTPAPGQLGNLPRNYFRGPGSFNMDAVLMKRTRITESVNLEIRADAINVTNTPTFGFPTATVSSATFGRIRDTVVSGSRKIQLGAKINF